MDRSAIILAESSEGKLSEDRGLLKLDNKPLLNHVVDAVKGIVGEVLVVTPSKEQAEVYAKMVSSANVQFAVNEHEPKGALTAALAGFEAAQGKYSLLLPSDAPFVSKGVVSLLFDCCIGKSAVILRWPDRQIEPLHAVYDTKKALEATKETLASGELDLDAMACKLKSVRYISTMVIEQLDPDYRIFFRIKTPLDLKKAAANKKQRKQ